ncbi:MAG: DUF3089 domain-containing protein [Myxococcota bacterium]
MKSYLRTWLILSAMLLPACSPGCFLTPGDDFGEVEEPPAPDYSESESWAALPFENDNADLTPPGHDEMQADAPADVFFVHPTTFFDRKRWNAPVDDAKARSFVDQMVMSGQASVFNGCCKVYAPRYRQATIGTYFASKENASGAFGLAYSDVERAFDVFLAEHNKGRPFILASHSQGSQHAMRLLERIDADEELRERLVAAYTTGFTHPMSRYDEVYEHLEPCETPEQTGCIVAWDTYKQGADVELPDRPVYWKDGELTAVAPAVPRQCTNPVTWRQTSKPSPKEAHQGAVKPVYPAEELSFTSIMLSDEPLDFEVEALSEPRPTLFSAECKNQALRVPDLEQLGYEATETTPGNYHLLDYRLFYMDIRENAVARTSAFLDARADPD